jgi:hypothetical protein
MLGAPGAWILLIMLFMAIVSTGCAEIIAVATILTYDVYCEYLNPKLKSDRMKNRQVFYATMTGKANVYTGTELLTVQELASKSIEKIPLSQVAASLSSLETANILPEGRVFTDEERKAILSALTPYVETSGSVTYELFYFAVQSQVLSKLSLESAVMLRIMKIVCCIFAIVMGFLAIFLQFLGLGLGFVYMSMGIFVGPAVAPAALAILMEKASAKWCTFGAIAGLFGGVTTWVATAWVYRGEVTIASLGGDYPFLYSNLVSILFSGFVAIAGSMANPDTDFKWEHLGVQLPLVDDMPPPIADGKSPEELDAFLVQSYNRSVFWANFLFFFLCLLFPFALYGSGMIFGATSFSIWIAVFMGWCFIGGLTVIILPIVDFKKDVAAAAAMKEKEALASKNGAWDK